VSSVKAFSTFGTALEARSTAVVGFGCEQRMGEGEGMAQGFIGQAVGARRKGSRQIQAGLAAFLRWATAVGFPAWLRHRRRLEKGRCRAEKKGNTGKKKGKERMGTDRWGRRPSE